MTFSPALTALADYLAGEFDNQAQAIAEPARYVHLRLWQKPVPLFSADSITLFAEQASVVKLNQPYRQRLMRLQEQSDPKRSLQVQYYMPKDPAALSGAGANPAILQTLTPEQFELLPGCLLAVTPQQLAAGEYRFSANLLPDTRCCFTYRGNTQQVSLGFEATVTELYSYDKGIDMNTGKATWGAIWGPFHFQKRQSV